MTKDLFAIKTHNHHGEVLVAACDEILLGKTFEEGELQLQVHISFYDGIRVDEKGLIRQLGNSTIANLVGENAINCAKKAGLIDDECVIHIQGVPHAQIYRMS